MKLEYKNRTPDNYYLLLILLTLNVLMFVCIGYLIMNSSYTETTYPQNSVRIMGGGNAPETKVYLIDDNGKIEPESLIVLCTEVGETYNISPYLLMAICYKESDGNVNEKTGNCLGLMQVDPTWHTERFEKLNGIDWFDPYTNMMVAADYLSELREQNGDLYYILMHYNMGTKLADSMYANNNISDYATSVELNYLVLRELY